MSAFINRFKYTPCPPPIKYQGDEKYFAPKEGVKTLQNVCVDEIL